MRQKKQKLLWLCLYNVAQGGNCDAKQVVERERKAIVVETQQQQKSVFVFVIVFVVFVFVVFVFAFEVQTTTVLCPDMTRWKNNGVFQPIKYLKISRMNQTSSKSDFLKNF